jgi:hypothetical protein
MDYKAIADGVYIALSYVAVFVAGWRISHLRTFTKFSDNLVDELTKNGR